MVDGSVAVREVLCRSALSRSGIYGVDYSVNPYIGCQHACAYCYARFMARGIHRRDEWGSFVDVKVNALERLADELPRRPRGIVLVSSVTDPYQPLEERYGLTRGVLRLLGEHRFPTTVLTKSDLVLRDTDLLRGLENGEVGLTITTLEEEVRRVFEPRAAPVEARLEALRRLGEAGVQTFAFIGPMLPHLTERTLPGLLDRLRAAGVGRVLVDRLNLKAGNWASIRRALEENLPDLLPGFEEALFGPGGYYERLRQRVAEMCRTRGLNAEFCY